MYQNRALSVAKSNAQTPMTSRHLFHILLLATLLTGCEVVESIQNKVVGEHRLRSSGRTGVLVAMEVHDNATRRIQTILERGDTSCHMTPPTGAWSSTITIQTEILNKKDQIQASWTETRTVQKAPNGSLLWSTQLQYTTHEGRKGKSSREERQIGDQRYTREENLPFVVKRVSPAEQKHFLQRALDPIPSLLVSGGDTWTQENQNLASTGETGKSTVRCLLPPRGESWSRRLLENTELHYAEVTRETNTLREASARWILKDQQDTLLKIDIREEIGLPADLSISAPTKIASIHRDRPYKDIQTILRKRLKLSHP